MLLPRSNYTEEVKNSNYCTLNFTHFSQTLKLNQQKMLYSRKVDEK